MKWFLGGAIIGIMVLAGLGYFFRSDLSQLSKTSVITPTVTPLADIKEATPTQEPLIDYSEYSFDSLSQKKFTSGKIKLGAVLKKEDNFTSYVFTYQSDSKTISGMANLPLGTGPFPVIVLLRGYADSTTYHIGLGTERSANYLAENGFLTLAPDFLGYGYSDWEDKDILKARFYRPVEVLNLLSAINSLASADSTRIGLWGHSNGGQIALSILEITGKSYPTSLWAPVSLDFPECVLTYLGAEEDVGNPVKEKVDLFLRNNDSKKFSIGPYFTKIKTSFIIHQGTFDELIKMQWTQNLLNNLKANGSKVDYYTYSRENHNFNRYEGTGDTLRQRDLKFFKKYLISN